MMRKFLKAVVLVACLSTSSVWAEDLLVEEFKTGDFANWEDIPPGADYAAGFLKLTSATGQASMNTVKEFQNCEMTLRFSLETVSKVDDTFYYLGFQTIQPWMRDAIYVMVQGSSLVIMVSKNGEVEFQQSVPDLSVVPGKEYKLTIQWTPNAITVLLDEASIFYTEDVAKIPAGPLYAFMAANKVGNEGEAAILNALSLNITGL